VALYLLDSNAIIDYLHDIASTQQIIHDLASQGQELCVCDVVLDEIFTGTFPVNERKTRALLEPMTFLSTSRDAAEQAGRWRFQFSRRGMQISLADSLIAATALDHDATVVTGNLKDFPMPELHLLPLPR
jgi:predicted nucleic acid-binding protein